MAFFKDQGCGEKFQKMHLIVGKDLLSIEVRHLLLLWYYLGVNRVCVNKLMNS